LYRFSFTETLIFKLFSALGYFWKEVKVSSLPPSILAGKKRMLAFE